MYWRKKKISCLSDQKFLPISKTVRIFLKRPIDLERNTIIIIQSELNRERRTAVCRRRKERKLKESRFKYKQRQSPRAPNMICRFPSMRCCFRPSYRLLTFIFIVCLRLFNCTSFRQKHWSWKVEIESADNCGWDTNINSFQTKTKNTFWRFDKKFLLLSESFSFRFLRWTLQTVAKEVIVSIIL